MFIHGLNGHRIRSWAPNSAKIESTETFTDTIPGAIEREGAEGPAVVDENDENTGSENSYPSYYSNPSYYYSGHIALDVGEEEDRIMWPRDVLPEKLPNSRILTYGYNCVTTNSSRLELMSREWIRQTARCFLEDLVASGIDQSGRASNPLIFVSHDIGGVIVKDVRTYVYKNEHC